MPLYYFVCNNCNQEEEMLKKMNDPLPDCKKCGSKMKRKMVSSNFHLKGNGWAKDLYHKKK